MAKTKKTKKNGGGGDGSGKKAIKKLAKKIEEMREDIGAAQDTGRVLGARLDEGLKTLANDLRKISTGIEAHVNAVKFEAGKQVEAVKSEAAREIAALKADMVKQIGAAKSETARLVEAVKAEAASLLADASKASDQAIATLKADLAQARAEIEKAVQQVKSGGNQRPAAATRAKATASKPVGGAAKSPLKRPPTRNGDAAKDDASA